MGTLITDRMVLRPFREEDAESMFRNWTSDEEVARYCRWYRHKNLKSTEYLLHLYLKEAADGFAYRWCITEKGQDDSIGCVDVVDIRDHRHTAILGYVIARRFWGQGYMTEAVKTVIQELFRCGFRKVIGRHHIDNPASGRVMEKCGMHFVGYEQEIHKIGSQELCDVKVYEITKP
ncbi:MAG: GNAT family N-acetyltransferase [Clostridia bacterium]|nr:GNAT family N-acetyltransferase [Clostridia bacterium]